PTPTDIYTLSLHDALPICPRCVRERCRRSARSSRPNSRGDSRQAAEGTQLEPAKPSLERVQPPLKPNDVGLTEHCGLDRVFDVRSEEHTSELQSRSDLVCR